jgi:hypothetical protein
MSILKFFLVLSLAIVGTWLLLAGHGVGIPVVEYKGLKASNVPAGVVVLVIAVAIARLWVIKTVETETVRTIETAEGKITEKVFERTKTSVMSPLNRHDVK